MNPNMILAILLTITAMRSFASVSRSHVRGRALKRGGYDWSASATTLDLLTGVAMVALWWVAAIATGYSLLGWIPTVGLVATFIAITAETTAAKKSTTKETR